MLDAAFLANIQMAAGLNPPNGFSSRWIASNLNGSNNAGISNSDLISSWKDLGPDARDLSSSGTNRPTYSSTGSAHAGPAVQFTNANNTKITTTFVGENQSVLTLGFIMRINPPVPNGNALDFFNTGGSDEFFATDNYNNSGVYNGIVAYRGFRFFANGSYDASVDTGWMLVCILCNGSSSKIAVQRAAGGGLSEVSGDVGSQTLMDTYVIGNYKTGGSGIDGFIDEVIVYKNDSYTTLLAYLKTKLGVS